MKNPNRSTKKKPKICHTTAGQATENARVEEKSATFLFFFLCFFYFGFFFFFLAFEKKRIFFFFLGNRRQASVGRVLFIFMYIFNILFLLYTWFDSFILIFVRYVFLMIF
jgi:hypothetical protein